MKRSHPLLTAALACFTLFFGITNASAADSGSTQLPKLTKIEIIDLLQPYPLAEPTNYYEEEPSLTAPHTTGKVRQEILESGLNSVNAMRRLAGLPGVTLNEAYSTYAQAGSVLCGVIGTLDHTPTITRYPILSEMDPDFYDMGYYGTSHSNLASYMLLSPDNSPQPQKDPIASSIYGYMSDSSGYRSSSGVDMGNVTTVGHRRWILYPKLASVSLGLAHRFGPYTAYPGYNMTSVYSSVYWDTSRTSFSDYQFISWPASGLFPNSVFQTNDPWSAALNPLQYSRPSKSSVEVTLTDLSTGDSWVFNDDRDYPAANTGAYFTVDTGGYGEGWAIIFRPEGIERYEGKYTVSITGLQTRTGEDTTLEYTVDFFTPTCLGGHSYTTKTVEATCTAPGGDTQTCSVCGKENVLTELPPLGHDYARTVVEAACETPGNTTDICSRCGDTVPIAHEDPLGHHWTEAPVSLDDGTHAVLCQREDCGAQQDPAPHGIEYVVEADGLPYAHCAACGYRAAALRVDTRGNCVSVALDHVPGPVWVIAARYDGDRLLDALAWPFTEAGTYNFRFSTARADAAVRVFFLNEALIPQYPVQ